MGKYKIKGGKCRCSIRRLCKELFPEQHTAIDVAIEDLVLKATDKIRITKNQSISYDNKVVCTGYYCRGVLLLRSEKVIKLKEWETGASAFFEREQTSGQVNTLLRKLGTFRSKTEKSKLLGFVDGDGKFKIRDNVKKSRQEHW